MANVYVQTDENGNVVGRREYDAFGNVLSETGDWSQTRFGFNANWMELKDSEGKLALSPTRLYDKATGRFLSRDPLPDAAMLANGAAGNALGQWVNSPYEGILQIASAEGAASGPYPFAKNNPLCFEDATGLTEYDAKKTAAQQGRIYVGKELRSGDKIVNTSIGTIAVKSGNLENGDKDYRAAECMLAKLGFRLPRSENGVYWAEVPNDSDGHTVIWQGAFWDSLNYTFINSKYKGSSKTLDPTFLDFVVALYHEVKGHNVDEATHSNPAEEKAFDTKYEKPIYDAWNKLQKECPGELKKQAEACKVGS